MSKKQGSEGFCCNRSEGVGQPALTPLFGML